MKKTVLITGATGGIGRNLAKVFAINGYNLVLTSTNLEKLETLKNELLTFNNSLNIDVFVCNLNDSNSSSEIYKFTNNKNYFIDILVNNAGFGNFGDFSKIPYEKEDELINVNIKALTQLTYLYLKDMIKNKKGKILNVGSIASFASGLY